MIPIPAILFLSSIGLTAFIDVPKQKFIFGIIATIIYYFCLLGIYRLEGYSKDKTARSMLSSSAVAAVFFLYACLYGIYMNFTVPLWLVLVAFFLASVLSSYQYFRLVSADRRKMTIYSLAMGIAMTEIAWVLVFWPFGYLTTGVVLLIFYYILWDMVYNHLIENLSKKRVLNNIAIFGLAIIIVLASSKWLPVV